MVFTSSTEYNLSYDSFGNASGVSAGDKSLATYEYYPNNGKLKKVTYGNGFSEEYVYNSLELLEEVCYTYSDRTSETVVEYTYTSDGQLHSVRDRVNDTYTVYEYDSGGKLIGSYEYSESDYVTYLASSYEYDGTEGALSNAKYKWNYTIGETEYNVLSDCYYYYNNDDTVSAFTLSLGAVSLDGSYTYDEFKRIGRVAYVLDTNFTISEEYTYAENDGYTTGLVEQYTHTVGNTSTTYNYTYDSKGNITKIVIGDKEIRYEYDDLGQLIREENGQSNQAVVYTYDNAGNVIQKTMTMLMMGYSEVTYYEYECSQWGDLLTAYRGRTIEYDDIGNPTTYYNGISYEFEWEGRRLVEAIRGSTDMYFTYNDEGIRTGKTVNNARTEYILNGSQILAEITETYIIVYIYDAYGSPIGMQYKSLSSANSAWEIYWYEKNLQGDVIAVCDSTGTQKVKYIYGGAWGDHSTAYPNNGYESAARYNPFRYRGYYYDSDLMLYYLQSRYYDPNTCRFINADNNFSNLNLFMYCGNNPINNIDPNGEHWYYLWLDDLIEAVDELLASVSNIVYGRASHVQSFYDPVGANDLWNSRPFQETKPSLEMQAFAELMYEYDFVTDFSLSISLSKTTYFKAGTSSVLSPSKNINASYIHVGVGESTPSVIPLTFSYSIGIVKGVNTKEDYSKDFLNIGAVGILGIDYGWWSQGASSYSFTISNSYGVYGGYDYYWCLN